MYFTDNDCKKKWKFIRDGYNRFKKKHNLDTASTAPKNSKDHRHQQLHFLNAVSYQRSCGSNLPDSPPMENEESTNISYGDKGPIIESSAVKGLSSILNTDIQDSVNSITEKLNNKSKEETTAHSKEKCTNKDDLLKMSKEREERRQVVMTSIMKTKEDDVDLFCRHIAEVLRHLPPVHKAEAKKHLNLVLSDYEIMAAKNFNGSSDCYASSTSQSFDELPESCSNESQNATSYSPWPTYYKATSTMSVSPTDLSCQANEESKDFQDYLNF